MKFLFPIFYFFIFMMPLFGDAKWEHYKQKTLSQASKIEGWCSPEKTLFLMDLVYKKKLLACVEVGVFAGKSFFPVAKTLKYLGKGVVYGIDGWSASIATKKLDQSSDDYRWWSTVNFSLHYKKTVKLIEEHQLDRYCRIMKQSSIEALALFGNETVDFIHIDGSLEEETSLIDVELALLKLRDRGYLLLNKPVAWGRRIALVYLLERADLLSSFLPSADYYLFQKNEERMKKAGKLFDE